MASVSESLRVGVLSLVFSAGSAVLVVIASSSVSVSELTNNSRIASVSVTEEDGASVTVFSLDGTVVVEGDTTTAAGLVDSCDMLTE